MIDEEYKVSDLARLLDLSNETIRYYESIGLVNPRHDEENRYRYFLSTDFSRLYNVKMLRSLGFGLQEIRSFFYEKDIPQQKEAALEHAAFLEKELAELKRRIQVLGVMSEELGDMERLESDAEHAENEAFWLVPFRSDYSYDISAETAENIKTLLSKHSIPRYSYLLTAKMEPGLPCTKRLTGYSVRGTEEKPCESAIYIPRTRVLRFSYKLIAGERFYDAALRLGLYERLRGMGIETDTVTVFGHTINISTKDGVTYLGNMGYIPVEEMQI